MSKKKKENVMIDGQKIVEQVEIVEVLEPEEEIVEVSEPEEEIVKTIVGTVSNCTKLNIRKKPNAKADVLCTVNDKAKVTVEDDKVNDEWCKVVTEDQTCGYCMKKYITIE